MVATYDRHGVRFMYPDNWNLQDENPEPQAHCVTLQSPGSGFWMLQIFESGATRESLAAQVLESVKQEYAELESEPATQDVAGTSLVGYDIQFYCLDFVVSAHVRSFLLGDRLCVLLAQAEDSEFDEIAPVFLAITSSLIQEANRAKA